MPTEYSRIVRIGSKDYQLVSDDDYLSQMGDRFEPETVRLFDCLVSKNTQILDVGANIGCTSILFGQLGGRVVSFEPSPTTFRLLEKNIARSGLNNIELHNCALGASTEMSELTFAPNNRSGGFVSDKTKASAGHVTETIHIKRLDDIADQVLSPSAHLMDNLIKLDVEGFEISVINGARNVIDSHKPIVVMELNHWCLNAFQRICVPDFFDYLRGIFPILLAVEGSGYVSLHDESASYIVMYQHIIHFKYKTIVAAFNDTVLQRLAREYRHST